MTSATLLRWVAGSRGYPGRRMALGRDTLFRDISAREFKTSTRAVSAKLAIVSSVHRHSRDSRGKSNVTHFRPPTRRHRVPFASFYRIPWGREIPVREFSLTQIRRESKVKGSHRKFTLHVRDTARRNYARDVRNSA